jgi:ATP-dependent protease ClpP protease subunit
MKSLLCTTPLALSLLAPVTHAADIWIDSKYPDMINFHGEIVSGDSEKFSSLLTQGFNNGTPIKMVRLNSVGGQVLAGVDIANKIRTLGINTIVGNGDECASMCVLMFAAGEHRGHVSTSRIGVHSATMTTGLDGLENSETKDAMAVSIMLSRLYKEYGTPDSIIGKMVTTPSDQITWLRTDELIQGGFSTFLDDYKPDQPTSQPTRPVQPVQPAESSRNWVMTCWNSKGEDYQVTLYPDYTLQVHDTVYKVSEWHWRDRAHVSLVATGFTEKGTQFTAVFAGENPEFTYAVGKPNFCRAE